MPVRDFQKDDVAAIARLMHSAVHALPDESYTPEQREAWAPTPPDFQAWQQRLSRSRPLVAEVDATVCGFIELCDTGYIDCFYVHPAWQGRGIGDSLFQSLLVLARERRIELLTVDASMAAKAFFAARGFTVNRRNSVAQRGQLLINFSMSRPVNGTSSPGQ